MIMDALRFKFEGLDDLTIKKLKVSYTFSKRVKYHFIFNKLTATSTKLNTDAFVYFM